MNVVRLGRQFHKPEIFTAYFFQDRSFTNVETASKAMRFGQGLRQLGQMPGDIVATILPNCGEIPSVYEGILRRGAVLLPVIFALTAPEMAYILRDSRARFVVTTSSLLEKVTAAMESCPQEFTVIVVDGQEAGEFLSYEALLEGSPETDEIVDREWDDAALLMYTSGTTGEPKGVMITHENIAGYFKWDFYDSIFGPGSRLLITLPMNHAFGLLVMVMTYLKYGGTFILHEWFDPVKALQDIEKYRVTMCPLVPTMLLMLLAQRDSSSYDTSSVRVWFIAAAPFPQDKIREVEEHLGGTIINDYGLTEASEVACQELDAMRKPGSVGRPFPGMQVKVVDRVGKELPPGEWGEIWIKGWCVMKGYINRPDDTAGTLRDGWLHSGDVGYLDEDGHLFITDRIKDMVLRGGENIYSTEVENALFKHPAVAEACVIGLPDPKYGEEVFAFVVLRAGRSASEAEILAEAQKHIPRYKCPKRIEFWSELPKTRTGKILKRAVRERVLERT